MTAAPASLGDLTWPEVAGRAATTVLAVPVGSTEQHGPHLPLSTDTTVAQVLAGRLAAERPDVIVAPALPYGASGEHAGFPGTLSIGTDALEAVLIELARSADCFAGVVFVSAHGGNAEALGKAVNRLNSEGRPVRAWGPRQATDAHAGHTETSVLLAVAPGSVRTARAEAGNRAPLATLMPTLRRDGVAAVSPNGVLGDPAGATAAAGDAQLQEWAADLIESLKGWP